MKAKFSGSTATLTPAAAHSDSRPRAVRRFASTSAPETIWIAATVSELLKTIPLRWPWIPHRRPPKRALLRARPSSR